MATMSHWLCDGTREIDFVTILLCFWSRSPCLVDGSLLCVFTEFLVLEFQIILVSNSHHLNIPERDDYPRTSLRPCIKRPEHRKPGLSFNKAKWPVWHHFPRGPVTLGSTYILQPSLYFHFHVCGVHMCAHACTRVFVCVKVRVWYSTSSSITLPLYSSRQAFQSNPELTDGAALHRQLTLEISCLPSEAGITGELPHPPGI